MHLLFLPEDVLREIFDLLDLESKIRMWEAVSLHPDESTAWEGHTPLIVLDVLTCSVRGTDLKICLAGNTSVLYRPAVVEFLAPLITDLDLSGIVQLTVDVAKSALIHFPNLTSLDVSKTSLDMYEAAEVCDACSKLATFASNFTGVTRYDVYGSTGQNVDISQVSRLQRSLSRLRYITFDVADIELFKCGNVYYVLQLCEYLLTLHINNIPDFQNTSNLSDAGFMSSPIPPTLRMITVFLGYSEVFPEKSRYNFPPDWQILGITRQAFSDLRAYRMTPKLMNEDLRRTTRCRSMETKYEILNNYSHLYMLHEDLEKHNQNLYEIVRSELYNNEGIVKCVSEDYFGTDRVYICPCSLPEFRAEKESNSYERNSQFFHPKLFTTQFKPGENFQNVSAFLSVCAEHNNVLMESLLLCLIPDPIPFDSITFLCILNCSLDKSFSFLFKTFRHLKTLRLMTKDYAGLGNYYAVLENIHESPNLRELVYIAPAASDDDVLAHCSRCATLEQLEYRVTRTQPTLHGYKRLLTGCPSLKKIVLHEGRGHITSTLRNFYLSNMQDRVSLTVKYRKNVSYGQIMYDDTYEHDPLNIRKLIKFN